MRILTIGNLFSIPMFLYDIFLYGAILLTLILIGMIIFGTVKKKEKKYYRVCWIILIAAVLMFIPIALSMIFGLGESVA